MRKRRKKNKKAENLYKGDLCKKKADCHYGIKINGMWICNYLAMTGARRECEADKCDKFIPTMSANRMGDRKKRKELFGYNLSRLLKCKGMRRSELAKLIKSSRKTVDTWCRGESVPRKDKLQELAKLLGVVEKEFERNKENEEVSRL